jgi:DNA-nicking Smr family endonuclease|tara:strand:+ start:162019 stop:162612 length:594 start_codon:yes stop_codon:yes gene_type:complete
MKKDKNKNKNTSAEDKKLWSFMTQDVTPLKGRVENIDATDDDPHAQLDKEDIYNNVAPRIEPARPQRIKAPAPQASLHHDLYNHADVDRRSFDKFRKGQMPIEASLDLHGYNQQQAYEKVTQFIARNAAMGLRCVMIITGKGRKDADGTYQEVGILKKSLPQWLEQVDLKSKILKVQQAQRFHGGSGAYYILLKRQK